MMGEVSPPHLVTPEPPSPDAAKVRDNEINKKELKPNKSMFCLLHLKGKRMASRQEDSLTAKTTDKFLWFSPKSQTKIQLPAKLSSGNLALPGNERNRILIAIWIIVRMSDLPTNVGNKSLLQI